MHFTGIYLKFFIQIRLFIKNISMKFYFLFNFYNIFNRLNLTVNLILYLVLNYNNYTCRLRKSDR